MADRYGIDKSLSGFTVESYNLSTKPAREEVRDEKNKVTAEIRYETRYDLQLTVRGESAPGASSITFDGQSWIVDDVTEAGTYNGLLRFNVTAHRYTGCNKETEAS